MQERRHALLLHYDEAIFELRVPKIVTAGPAVMVNCNGPSAMQRYVWDDATLGWTVAPQPADSGFEALIHSHVDAQSALEHALAAASPLDVERLLALLAGSITRTDTWFTAKEIDSCRIGEDEVVHRITVAQDDNASAMDFRFKRLQARSQRSPRTQPPQALAAANRRGVTADARIEWNVENRLFNVRCGDGRPALICYLGEASPQSWRMQSLISPNYCVGQADRIRPDFAFYIDALES